MNLRRFLFCLLLAALPFGSAIAGGKKEVATAISFHLQADSNENPKMVLPYVINGKQIFFRRLSEINSKDIESFNPFPSRDGQGYGLLLVLKPTAKGRIAALTAGNQQRWLAAIVNGRIVDIVMVERPVEDGQLVIWQGIGQGEIASLDKTLPRIGQKKPRN